MDEGRLNEFIGKMLGHRRASSLPMVRMGDTLGLTEPYTPKVQ